MTDDRTAEYALESSATEQSELDSLLVKLTTTALGFSVALGAFDGSSPSLIASWWFFVPSLGAVLLSKFLSIEALRAYYQGIRHKSEITKARKRLLATNLDRIVRYANYGAGLSFMIGAILVVFHMI